MMRVRVGKALRRFCPRVGAPGTRLAHPTSATTFRPRVRRFGKTKPTGITQRYQWRCLILAVSPAPPRFASPHSCAPAGRMPGQNKPRKSNDIKGAPYPSTFEHGRRAVVQGRAPFPTVPMALRIVFSIACHCSCADGFSLARARPCIVIGAHFPLQIDCIFLADLSRQCARRRCCGRSRRGAICGGGRTTEARVSVGVGRAVGLRTKPK
jgi:hypothetical protein